MNDYVVDTHALYWYLTNDTKLGVNAKTVFDEAAKGKVKIWISSIVVAEIYYLLAKQDQSILFRELFEKMTTAGQFELADFTAKDVLAFEELVSIPEMHDRIIAALAKRLAVPCLTKDEQIKTSGLIQTIW